MALEIAGEIREECERSRVRLREAVLAEPFDLLENLLGELERIATRLHAIEQLSLEQMHRAAAVPCGHGASEKIRLPRCEAGRLDRDLHHLFLKNRYAERLLQNAFQFFARIRDRARIQTTL